MCFITPIAAIAAAFAWQAACGLAYRLTVTVRVVLTDLDRKPQADASEKTEQDRATATQTKIQLRIFRTSKNMKRVTEPARL